MQPLAILQTARLPSVHNSEKPDGANQPTSDAQSKRLLTPVEPVQDTARSQLAGTAGALHIKPAVPAPLAPVPSPSPNIGIKNLRDPAAQGWPGSLAPLRGDFDAALVHDAGRRDQLREASSARWRRVHPRL